MEIAIGVNKWSVEVPPEKAVVLARAAILPLPTASPRELVRGALETPFGFEPLRRALTPDDRVTVVFDPGLPHAAEFLAGVIEHLGTAGIAPGAVTVLTTPGSSQGWIDELPDEYADVRTETHDPADRKKLAYLATTQTERRVYLNRTLVEGEFVVVLTGRGYDPHTGYSGAEAAIFPALADEEAQEAMRGLLSTDAPAGMHAEAHEIAWLLGTPFLVQVILGSGDAIQEVVAGLLDSGVEGIGRHDSRWRGSVPTQPDLVIAAVSGDPKRLTFRDFAQAAACAARVVSKGGRIALLAAGAPPLGDGATLLRSLGSPKGAYKRLARLKPDDWAAAHLWAFAAKQASLFVASGYPDDIMEDLFATPIRTASEVGRLIAAAESVLVIPDAHRSLVTVEES